jgi:DNA replication protein DnaC
MLKLVLGRSGSGKTHFVTEIAQQAIKGHENAVIIVPE